MINSKYNTTMETYPKDIKQIDLMLDDFRELKSLKLETGQEPFIYVVDYRILNSEAEKLFIEGQKYGDLGTTKGGFGCKLRPLILESAFLRSSSANKGFEAADLFKKFVDKYPNEAKSLGFSFKNVLFLNATFYRISRDAVKDSDTISHFCPANETLEIYRRQFRKETNLSEDFINNLNYEDAVTVWKRLMGIR